MHKWLVGWLVLGIAVCGLVACQDNPFPLHDELSEIRGLYSEHRFPADPTNAHADDPAAIALGRSLFTDPGVSSCGTVSCSSCHVPPDFTVHVPKATGCGGQLGARNPPTLWNVAADQWFFWDGSKDSLWAQPSGPLLNPKEMDSTPEDLRTYLQANYASQYESVFGEQPGDETDADEVVGNFGKALEAYMRTLVRVDAPFDTKVQHFIQSAQDGKAETDPFYLSMKTFVRTGRCVVCHNGPWLSDQQFHNLGLDEHGVVDHGRAHGIDLVLIDAWNGASEYSDDSADGAQKLDTLKAASRDGTDGAFKTASLRNVARTAPYMHNGSLATLGDVVDFYDRGGDPVGTFAGQKTSTIIPLNLTAPEKQSLIDLLNDLTGVPNG